jgi:hypothetical protein
MTKSVKVSLLVLIGAVAAGPALSASAAQRQSRSPNDRLEQNFLVEHEIGRHFQVSPADLPAPKTGPIVTR